MNTRRMSTAKTGCLIIVILFLVSFPVYADINANKTDDNSLPDILSLEDALNIAEINGSPERDIAEAELLESSAELASVQSRYGVRIKAELSPRYVYAIDPSEGNDINDS